MGPISKHTSSIQLVIKTHFSFFLLLFLLSLLFFSCAPRVAEPIILFVFKDQTDTPSLNPTRLLTASQLAHEEMARRTQQVTSRLPRMVYLTYTGPEVNGLALAREFIESNSQVVAIIGDINSQGTRLLAQLAEEKELLHLSFFATDESIFQEHAWSFSYRERISNETKILMRLLHEYLTTSNPLLLVNDLQNLTPRWMELQTRIKESSGNAPPVIVTNRNQIDFSQELSKIKQFYSDIDSIVIFLSTQQNQHFLQQASLHHITSPIIISSIGLDPEHFLEFSGLDLEMYSFTFQHFLDHYKNSNLLLEQFAQRYQVSMGFRRIDSLGPWIYDGVLLLLEALQVSSTSRDIREYLSNIEHLRLVGSIGFATDGNLSRNTFVPIQLKDGYIRELLQ